MQKNKLSNYDKAVMQAFDRGYDITKAGKVRGLRKDYLSLYESGKGYLGFGFTLKDDTNTRVKAHKMQAYKKFGDEMFKNGIRVNHLNNNKKDNSYDNIVLGYPSDISSNDTKNNKNKGNKKDTKLTSEEVKEIASLIGERESTYRQISNKFDVSRATISDIASGRTWQWLTGLKPRSVEN